VVAVRVCIARLFEAYGAFFGARETGVDTVFHGAGARGGGNGSGGSNREVHTTEIHTTVKIDKILRNDAPSGWWWVLWALRALSLCFPLLVVGLSGDYSCPLSFN